MRNLLTLLILFFTLQTCPAQQIEIMGSALLECEYYKRMVTDTLHRENDFSADNMILRIGKEISMFYNPKGMKYDSLGCYNKNWHYKCSWNIHGRAPLILQENLKKPCTRIILPEK